MSFLSTNDIIAWVKNWALNNSNPQESDISLFVKNLNEKMANLNYAVPDAGTVIGYAGKIDANNKNTPIFYTVDSVVQDNRERLCFINYGAENFLNLDTGI